jgi:5-methylcytosine-specific restriction protein A
MMRFDDPKTPRKWYGNSRAWRRRAARQLAEFPICAYCLERGGGIITPATIADHIEPVDGKRDRLLLGRLQSLCSACHASRKQREEIHGYRPDDVGPDGMPLDPRHPFNRG